MIKKKSYWLKKKKIHTLRILDEEQSAALICEGPMEARLERVSEIREKACV